MSNYKPRYILAILHTIDHQLSSDGLFSIGLDYFQIAKLISEVLQEGWVKDTDAGLLLTDIGKSKLEELNKQIYPSNPKSWILPSEENRIPKMDKFDIYLPKKRNFED